mmetsp:Transcript_13205/g.29002  ORF Transcript_13205/g.29002 Transcript_13205/m.29002 type:complete len:368 (-) Transcript_13205:366-1469(-)
MSSSFHDGNDDDEPQQDDNDDNHSVSSSQKSTTSATAHLSTTDDTTEDDDDKTNHQSTTNKTTAPLDFSRLWDIHEPEWVLVKDGSLGGYFDWVPRSLRKGPWSPLAVPYLTIIVYGTALAVAYEYGHGSDSDTTTTATTFDHHNHNSYPPLYSLPWYYNAINSLWMLIVMLLVVRGPLSWRAWATYTVQSWTLLWTRHVLCALAPMSATAARWAEITRFPAACSATVTFGIWNGVLFPYVYLVRLGREPDKQRNFFQFCFSFRLVQIHVLNILFCYLNVAWWSPTPRVLTRTDFGAAMVSVLVYMMWYLLVLDRLGVHLYPVFSPRAPWYVVLMMWTLLLATYGATFVLWRAVLRGNEDTTVYRER